MPQANVSVLPATCGVGCVYSHDSYYADELTVQQIKQRGGGIGYNVAGFVNGPRCKGVYNFIKDNFDIVFQSPVKKNRRSGRKFFFIVFKEKEQ